MLKSILLAIFVVIILFQLSIPPRRKVKQCGEFINGFWKADPGWCSRAGISNAYATINFFPDKKYGVIYLLMQNQEGQIVDNDSYTFRTTVSMKEMIMNKHGNTECNLMFEEGKNPVSGMFPTSCKLRINVVNGVIVLHDGSTVFLELFKDSMTSARIERMSHTQFKETYLLKQPRTDPQGDIKEGYLPERPRTDPQADVYDNDMNPSALGEINGDTQDFKSNNTVGNSEGESITMPVDESEGQAI